MLIEKRFGLAERHKDFNRKAWENLRKQDKAQIESISTFEARIVYNWHRQVAGCYQRARAFSRLKINRHGIIYGYIEPEHFVEDLAAEWFLSRFPMFVVMVESSRGTYVVSKDSALRKYDKKIEELMPEFEKRLPENEILTELDGFNSEEFWEGYYSSQLIKERKNKKYFLKNIPKKFHSWESLNAEKKEWNKNKKLDEF